MAALQVGCGGKGLSFPFCNFMGAIASCKGLLLAFNLGYPTPFFWHMGTLRSLPKAVMETHGPSVQAQHKETALLTFTPQTTESFSKRVNLPQS